MTDAEQIAAMQEWLDRHTHIRTPYWLDPNLDRYPGERDDDVEVDPYGKRADEAAATWENNWLRQGEWAQ